MPTVQDRPRTIGYGIPVGVEHYESDNRLTHTITLFYLEMDDPPLFPTDCNRIDSCSNFSDFVQQNHFAKSPSI
jgi:hypothetical protein